MSKSRFQPRTAACRPGFRLRDEMNMSDQINRNRRKSLGAAAFGTAVAPLILAGPAQAQSAARPAAAAPTRTKFASLKQIDAGVLNVGYAEDGPADGPPVILLHGWPYDIHSFVDVTPVL